jgi:hypothetical protein
VRGTIGWRAAGCRFGDRLRRGLRDRLRLRRLLHRLLDGDAAAVRGDLDVLGLDRLLGRAEEIGEGALAHAGALLIPSHG